MKILSTIAIIHIKFKWQLLHYFLMRGETSWGNSRVAVWGSAKLVGFVHETSGYRRPNKRNNNRPNMSLKASRGEKYLSNSTSLLHLSIILRNLYFTRIFFYSTTVSHRAAKRLLAINCIQNKSLFTYYMCVYIYYVYINTHTHTHTYILYIYTQIF